MKLQRLRIPSGWKVTYNSFCEIAPPLGLPEEDDMWLFFTQDLLQIINENKNIEFMIDLGWIPEGDPEGSFHVQVIKNKNWDEPLEEFKSQDQKMITEKIENYLERYSYK